MPRRVPQAALLVAARAGLAACGGGTERAAVTDPCSRAPRAGDRVVRLIAGTPPVRFHVPEALRAHRRVPLVLGLHGAGQDAESFEAQSASSTAPTRSGRGSPGSPGR